jgi:hypothetical protein
MRGQRHARQVEEGHDHGGLRAVIHKACEGLGPERRSAGPFSCPYAPKCVEEEFSEVGIQEWAYAGRPPFYACHFYACHKPMPLIFLDVECAPAHNVSPAHNIRKIGHMTQVPSCRYLLWWDSARNNQARSVEAKKPAPKDGRLQGTG